MRESIGGIVLSKDINIALTINAQEKPLGYIVPITIYLYMGVGTYEDIFDALMCAQSLLKHEKGGNKYYIVYVFN